MKYRITPITSDNPIIKMSSKTAINLGITNIKRVIIIFGKEQDEAWIEIDDSLSVGVINIEESIIDYLQIISSLSYEIRYKNQKLLIGPVIGILISKKAKYLKEKLTSLLVYSINYPHLNGLLFLFSEEEIDFVQNKINGYWYNPETKSWTEGVFPFPSIIFRRADISNASFRNLSRKMGTNIFNSYYFNKWEFWNWIKPFPSLVHHLPQTDNKITKNIMDEWIEKYDGVYLKPVKGSTGKGIYFITKNAEGYEIKDKTQIVGDFYQSQEINHFLENKKNHIFQQPINIKTYDDRKIDYRVAVLKDMNNTWFCGGIIGRFGKKSGITSNFRGEGFAIDAFEAIKLQFDCNKKEAYRKYEAMCNLAIQFADIIDKIGGPYIELGLDMAFDEDGKVWLIEVNKRQDQSIYRSLNNKKIYYNIKLHPLRYAKQLAMDEL